MNIQLYVLKKNFDTQKAERFFKERNIKYQVIDLNKCKLGKRELDVFLSNFSSIEDLIDRNGKNINKHKVALLSSKEYVIQAVLEDPTCLKTPIIRNGNKVIIGYDEKILKDWLNN